MIRAADILGSPRRWAIDLTIATGIGAFLGVIGPFGSFNNGPVEQRVLVWVVNFWIGLAIFSVLVRSAILVADRLDLPRWFAMAVGVMLGLPPLRLITALILPLLAPGEPSHLEGFWAWYGQALVLSVPTTLAYYFIVRRGDLFKAPPGRLAPITTQTPTPMRGAAPLRDGFLARLPPRLGADLICLQMEDHYVRAHTMLGSELVLIPLREAIAELGDLEGMQVHRSWWVRREAVRAVAPDGRSYRLELKNGLAAPVSRTAVAALRAAGWLEGA